MNVPFCCLYYGNLIRRIVFSVTFWHYSFFLFLEHSFSYSVVLQIITYIKTVIIPTWYKWGRREVLKSNLLWHDKIGLLKIAQKRQKKTKKNTIFFIRHWHILIKHKKHKKVCQYFNKVHDGKKETYNG